MTSPPLTLRTAAPDATRAVGAAIARLLEPGDVVALTGELGAGKTCLVQGAAAALGVTGPVTSPTFTLVKTYVGDLPVVHCDVYRLDRLQQVIDLGDDVMAPDAVTFVEWGDAIAALLPPDCLEVELLFAPGADDPAGSERQVRVRGHGRWQARMGELEISCERYIDRSADTAEAPPC